MVKQTPKLADHPRQKMPVEMRAKQFMPFSAVSGLEEALRRKEWEIETRQSLGRIGKT
ncbi:hypothetical protein IKF94_02735 [Candidatus Saccharibacteria bacterium]|nr:hypothetical protein [Candidatus Saccharibacteria bacterium]